MALSRNRPMIPVWLVIGSMAGVALSEPFSRWILLLVPAVLAAAWLLWHAQPGREALAAVTGLGSGPLLIAWRGRYPDCLTDGIQTACEPTSFWPWLLLAALLVLGGVVAVLWPQRLRVEHGTETADG